MLFGPNSKYRRAKGHWLGAVCPIERVSYLRGRNGDIPHTTRLPLVSRQRKKEGAPLWERPPSFHECYRAGSLSPTRRLYVRLYPQMVSAASLPEVRAQPLLAPEGLLEPMTAPTTSPQANRPWMDSPALFWTSSEPLTTRPPMVVA